jgi:hypothetical protein
MKRTFFECENCRSLSTKIFEVEVKISRKVLQNGGDQPHFVPSTERFEVCGDRCAVEKMADIFEGYYRAKKIENGAGKEEGHAA